MLVLESRQVLHLLVESLAFDSDLHAIVGLYLVAECDELLGEGYTCDEESNFTTEEDVRVCIDA